MQKRGEKCSMESNQSRVRLVVASHRAGNRWERDDFSAKRIPFSFLANSFNTFIDLSKSNSKFTVSYAKLKDTFGRVHSPLCYGSNHCVTYWLIYANYLWIKVKNGNGFTQKVKQNFLKKRIETFCLKTFWNFKYTDARKIF